MGYRPPRSPPPPPPEPPPSKASRSIGSTASPWSTTWTWRGSWGMGTSTWSGGLLGVCWIMARLASMGFPCRRRKPPRREAAPEPPTTSARRPPSRWSPSPRPPRPTPSRTKRAEDGDYRAVRETGVFPTVGKTIPSEDGVYGATPQTSGQRGRHNAWRYDGVASGTFLGYREKSFLPQAQKAHHRRDQHPGGRARASKPECAPQGE